MIRVVEAGPLCTVQDAGRPGWQHLGIAVGGAADPLSHALANLLVGNPPGAAALEFTLRGPTLVFAEPCRVALCGAPFPVDLEGRAWPRWSPNIVTAGGRLRIGETPRGLRGYLAVAGAIQVADVLGSRSTDLRGGFGGFNGRPLRAGDELQVLAGAEIPDRGPGWRLPWNDPLPQGPAERPLRLIPGPHWELLAADTQERLLAGTFTVDARSDRMGLRLSGPPIQLAEPLEALSAGVATGTLQLPPEGGPILLLADRQTTGGYPRLGELASVDLPWAAQLRPGDPLRFCLCTVAEAQAAWLAQQRRLTFLQELLSRERGVPERMGP